jgi:hypothetical protein
MLKHKLLLASHGLLLLWHLTFLWCIGATSWQFRHILKSGVLKLLLLLQELLLLILYLHLLLAEFLLLPLEVPDLRNTCVILRTLGLVPLLLIFSLLVLIIFVIVSLSVSFGVAKLGSSGWSPTHHTL